MKAEILDLFMGINTMSVVEAMEKIDKNAKGILFITDKDRIIKGCVSDGDIRRWLIKTGDLSSCVNKVMTRNPIVLYEKDRFRADAVMRSASINAVPIINSNRKIVDVELLSMTEQIKKTERNLKDVPTVIMAGGRGVRLYPYTKILPKPLIPVGDIPIVERIMDSFHRYDVNRFFMTLNYKKEMIKSYFSDISPGYFIDYVEEDKPLGTAGSIKLINGKVNTPFFVTNCDILILADYADIYDYHIDSGNDITIVSALKNMTVPYGVLNTGKGGELVSIREKPKNSYLINTGMYVLNPELIDMIPDNREYHMTELIEYIIKKGRRAGMYPISEDSFLDMGEFSEMKRMEDKLSAVIDYD